MIDSLQTFDLSRWTSLFRLDAIPLKSRRSAVGNSSPANIAVMEQVRGRLFPADAPTTPTDLFAFAEGEPERRDVTKWNGLPYRPAGMRWPKCDGEPMTFLAQFRFTESADLLPELPGDVLLVFVAEPALDDFRFEWYPLGLDKLISAAKVPPPHFAFPIVHGVRHRTVDYLAWPGDAESTLASLLDIDADHERKYPVYGKELRHSLCRLKGWKIGGLPNWMFAEERRVPGEGALGRFLCSIPIHWTDYDVPYPFVNRAAPISNSNPYMTDPSRSLYFSDGFVLNVFLREDGTVEAEVDYF